MRPLPQNRNPLSSSLQSLLSITANMNEVSAKKHWWSFELTFSASALSNRDPLEGLAAIALKEVIDPDKSQTAATITLISEAAVKRAQGGNPYLGRPNPRRRARLSLAPPPHAPPQPPQQNGQMQHVVDRFLKRNMEARDQVLRQDSHAWQTCLRDV